jgi:hypothetical protein
MRLKKKDIIEMVNNDETKLPNPNELNAASQNVQKLTQDIEKLNATMQDSMGSAFITKTDESIDMIQNESTTKRKVIKTIKVKDIK